MDALDVRILRAMGTQPYGRHPKPLDALKPGTIAKRVRATPERVHDRVQAMENAGVIDGYGAVPNHRHLGLERSVFYATFEDEDRVDRAMAKLEPVEGVASCCAFLGGMLCVDLTYRHPADLDRKLRVLLTVAGEAELRKFFDVVTPPVYRPLSRLDWRIVQALRPDGKAPLTKVARELGVSGKTVKRRLERMTGEGSVFIVPWLDASKAEGMFLFYLLVRGGEDSGPDLLGALHRTFDRELVAADVLSAPELAHYSLMLAAPSMAGVEALRRSASRVKGVAQARPFLIRAATASDSWVDEAIAERVASTAGGADTHSPPNPGSA